jgi:hypothetical protein
MDFGRPGHSRERSENRLFAVVLFAGDILPVRAGAVMLLWQKPVCQESAST